jgi:single-stranded DNA-binding protein
MSNTAIINICVLGGQALDDPISKRVKTKSGDTTSVATFVLRTYAGPKEPSMRLEIEAWSHLAAVVQHIRKGRRVIVTGSLLQQSWTDPATNKTQYKTFIRATQINLLDKPDTEEPTTALSQTEPEREPVAAR